MKHWLLIAVILKIGDSRNAFKFATLNYLISSLETTILSWSGYYNAFHFKFLVTVEVIAKNKLFFNYWFYALVLSYDVFVRDHRISSMYLLLSSLWQWRLHQRIRNYSLIIDVLCTCSVLWCLHQRPQNLFNVFICKFLMTVEVIPKNKKLFFNYWCSLHFFCFIDVFFGDYCTLMTTDHCPGLAVEAITKNNNYSLDD